MRFASLCGIGRPIMMRRRIALLAVGAIVLLAVDADAASHVSVHIGIGAPAPVIVAAPPPAPVYVPPPVYAAPPPPPPYATYGYVWVPAYSVWTGYGYQMVPGAWVRPPYRRAVWVAPHWEQGHGNGHGHGHAYGHDKVWVNGYWRH
jgi:hypothetical protein